MKLDVNCRKLSSEQLMSFIDRMMLTRNKEFIKEQLNQPEEKTQREKTSRTDNILSIREVAKVPRRTRNVLERKLENVEKDKEINDYLLTYTEISKFMLEQVSKS